MSAPARLTMVALGLTLALAAPLAGQRPLSLDEALRRAAEVSEAIGIARAGVSRAEGDEVRARSEFYPQLTGSAIYTRTLKSQFAALSRGATDSTATTSCNRFVGNPAAPVATRLDSLENTVACLSTLNPFGSFTDLPFGQRNQYNFGLSVSQYLYAGGRVRAQTHVARAGRRSAEVELASQQAQARLDVTQAYFDAALSDALLVIADSALVQAERTLRDVQLAREVGTKSEFELLRARVTRDNQRPVVIQRRQSREIAYLRLKQLLDLPLADSLQLTTGLGAEADSTLQPPSVAAAELADTAVERRAPVRRATETVRAQAGQLTVARAGARPTVRVTSQFSQLAYPGGGFPSRNDFITDWNVALAVSLPLFTGGRLRGERMVARANLEEAQLRLRQTSEQTALDTRSSFATLVAADAQWQASAGTVMQARRAYEIAEIRYREGLSTQTELSDARLALEQAQANRVQAARDLQVARTRTALLRDLPLSSAAGATAAPAGAASSAFTLTTSAGPAPAGTTSGTTPTGIAR